MWGGAGLAGLVGLHYAPLVTITRGILILMLIAVVVIAARAWWALRRAEWQRRNAPHQLLEERDRQTQGSDPETRRR